MKKNYIRKKIRNAFLFGVLCATTAFVGNIQEAQAQDMGAIALVAPATPMCPASNQTVTVTIQNFDGVDIDFSLNSTDVVVDITGTIAQSFTLTVSTGTLVASGTMDVDVTVAADFSAAGPYTVDAYTVVAGDLTPGNDAMASVIITVNPFPVVNLGLDTNHCGAVVALDAGNAGSSFMWSTGQTTQMANAFSSGT